MDARYAMGHMTFLLTPDSHRGQAECGEAARNPDGPVSVNRSDGTGSPCSNRPSPISKRQEENFGEWCGLLHLSLIESNINDVPRAEVSRTLLPLLAGPARRHR